MQYLKPNKETFNKEHHKEWRNCRRCLLKSQRRNTVLYRGCLPADVLFVGEAPGVNEDLWGYPFIGNAGDVLNIIIFIAQSYQDFSFCISNIIACIPRENGKIREPNQVEAYACRPRLYELYKACEPQVVILLGGVAAEYFQSGTETIQMRHPSSIARLDSHLKTPEILKCVSTIVNAVERHVTPF